MESSSAHMTKHPSASFKGPFSFKDREDFSISVRILHLNKMYETALKEQEAIHVEMVQLVAESRALKAPVVLRTKSGGGGVHPPYQLAEPRPWREQVVKLMWIGRAAGKQVKSDPMPFVPGCPVLTEHCARASELNMRMRVALCQSTTAREAISELHELLEVSNRFAA